MNKMNMSKHLFVTLFWKKYPSQLSNPMSKTKKVSYILLKQKFLYFGTNVDKTKKKIPIPQNGCSLSIEYESFS